MCENKCCCSSGHGYHRRHLTKAEQTKQLKCSCSSGHGYHRRHLTKAEQTEQLQKYAEELTNELQAVKERIEELK